MKTEEFDALETIRRCPGLFAGQFEDHIIASLKKRGLIETRYEGVGGIVFALAKVYVDES